MLVDTPICNFGLKAPDFELISHGGKSHSRDGLAGSNGLLNKVEVNYFKETLNDDAATRIVRVFLVFTPFGSMRGFVHRLQRNNKVDV